MRSKGCSATLLKATAQPAQALLAPRALTSEEEEEEWEEEEEEEG